MFNIGDHTAVVLNNTPTFGLRKGKHANVTENSRRNASRPSVDVANGIHRAVESNAYFYCITRTDAASCIRNGDNSYLMYI
jgi:hypothetical protein